jgi:hypothetical protein
VSTGILAYHVLFKLVAKLRFQVVVFLGETLGVAILLEQVGRNIKLMSVVILAVKLSHLLAPLLYLHNIPKSGHVNQKDYPAKSST